MATSASSPPPEGPASTTTSTGAPITTDCPACGGAPTDVFDGGDLPVNVGVFHPTREAALAAPRGRILLAHCGACGLVHNRAFDPDGRIFEPGYEVALHHSQTFRDFIDALARRLCERFDLHGKRIVEIGCGDGYVLRRLAETGGNHGLGIDPTVREEGPLDVSRGSARLVRDWFGDHHADHEADFVCSLSVFEDIPRPGPFLRAARTLAARRDAPLYFEVFNGWRAFEAGEVWSVHYEQCNYFSLAALRTVFERHGFRVENVGTCYGGDQYLFVEARADGLEREPRGEGNEPQGGGGEPRGGGDVPDALTAFAADFAAAREAWNARLGRWRERGERAVVWGTGGKGITFLNSVDGAAIEHVAEINPAKQGRHVPGTGQPIVPPEALAEIRPDHIVITNALYRDEMRAQARALGVEAEFHVA